LVFGAVRALPSLDTLKDAAPSAEVAVEESRDDGWNLVHVRWSDLQISFNRLDPDSPRFAEQVQGAAGFVQAAGEATPALYVLHARLSSARHVIGVASEPALRNADDLKRAEAVLSALLRSLNGLALKDGCILDPDLLVLLRPDGGDPDPDAEVPTPRSAVARRERSLKRLEPLAIEKIPDLPSLFADEEAKARDPKGVAERVQALWAVSVRAANIVDRKQAIDLLQKRDLWDVATEREQEFLLDEEPSQVERLRHASRREALATLLWALGRNRLSEPTEICNLEVLVRVLRGIPAQEFLADASLRPLPEILDEADFIARCHGAVAQALINRKMPPGGLKVSVVRERHAALYWLLGNENHPWDVVADGA
jgi:hypothetical protein